jgi:hypothetical protein
MKQDYRRILHDVDARQAQVELDQATYDRSATLIKTDATPRANYDQARFTLQSDKSKLASLGQQADVQLAKLRGKSGITVHARYRQVVAMLLAGRLAGRVDTRLLLGIGLGLTSWAYYAMTGWTPAVSQGQIVGVGLVQAAGGLGCLFVPLTSTSLATTWPATSIRVLASLS